MNGGNERIEWLWRQKSAIHGNNCLGRRVQHKPAKPSPPQPFETASFPRRDHQLWTRNQGSKQLTTHYIWCVTTLQDTRASVFECFTRLQVLLTGGPLQPTMRQALLQLIPAKTRAWIGLAQWCDVLMPGDVANRPRGAK